VSDRNGVRMGLTTFEIIGDTTILALRFEMDTAERPIRVSMFRGRVDHRDAYVVIVRRASAECVDSR
jgi:hypothetical protein